MNYKTILGYRVRLSERGVGGGGGGGEGERARRREKEDWETVIYIHNCSIEK